MRKTGQKRAAAATGLVILTLLWGVGCRRGVEPSPELQSLLASDTLDRQVGDAKVRSRVRAFYTQMGDTLAWSRRGSLKPADQALAVLASARDHGLDPEFYQWSALTAEREVLSREPAADRQARLAVFDIRLTSALLRLGQDVAGGRARPEDVDPRARRQRKLPELSALLAERRGQVHTWLEGVEPPHPEYAWLRQGLAALRGAEAKGGWPRVPEAALEPGSSDPAVAVLRRRLAASGDLGGAAVEGTRYDTALEEAVGVFQEHHGLPRTGRVDRRTLAVLNVPLADRIEQVAANLDRWRWLPDELGRRHFRVNIPYFHLEAYEDGRIALDIRTVVGKTGHETPIFSDRMSHVVMSPYWNIPPSIAKDETLPAITRDPGFLARQNIEIVRVDGGAADLVDPATLDWDDQAALEGLRFRQRPGAGNALGFVKFMFPNEHNVYVHDTPADRLFSRVERAFSHGCIRVEEPLTLAEYVLRDDPRWTRETISAAMHAGSETHVKLAAPIPIHIVYFTAWVDQHGGLHFRDDVYGLDARQIAAGKRRQSRRAAPAQPRPGRPGGGDAITVARRGP